MSVFYMKRNYGNVRLDDSTAENVPVRLRNGEHKYLRWRGFIRRDRAQWLSGKGMARPVLLLMSAYKSEDGLGIEREYVPEGGYLQGCLIDGVVYGVLDEGKPRVLYPGS